MWRLFLFIFPTLDVKESDYIKYMKPELDVPKSTEWKKKNQSQGCPIKKRKKKKKDYIK